MMIINFITSNLNFILIITLLLTLLGHILSHISYKDGMKERIQKVRSFVRPVLASGTINNDNNATTSDRSSSSESIKNNIIVTLRARMQGTINSYKIRLEQAGWSSDNSLIIYLLVNAGGLVIGSSIYLFLIFDVSSIAQQSLSTKLLLLFLFLFVCIRSFDYMLDYAIYRRYARIRKHMAFAVDLLGICVRAGLTLDKALEKIAEEMAMINPDICKEFTQAYIELDLIPDRHVAFRNLAKRVNMPIVQMLVGSLIQAEEQGASIGNTLTILSQEFTKHKILEIETKAARLPVLLSLPLALFSFPCMLIILLGPAIASISRSTIFNS